MQSQNCPSCGAPVAGGASFCQFCGTALTPAGGSLPSGVPGPAMPPTPPPPGYAGGAPPPPPPRRRSRLLIVIVVVVVIVIVVSVAAYALFAPSAPAVQVGYINVWAPDNVCGLGTNQIYYQGYNSSTGQSIGFELQVENFNESACIVNSVVTNSTGFSLSAIEVPLTVPGMGNSTMNLTITSPSSSFSGDLNLVFA